MQIIIPMSGRGQRFIEAGYSVVKPLIEVDGLPMIAHIIRMFDPVDDFIFICAKDHLETTPMREILLREAPSATIIPIDPHKKGPVYAVAQAFDSIDEKEPAIINYCDFGWVWDYAAFLQTMNDYQWDGAVVAYRGFHPHMLGTTNYAFMRHEGERMLAIQEKQPFTDNRMQEYASSGTYYFKNGQLLKLYCQNLLDQEKHVKGEYYVSLVYQLMHQAGHQVGIYPISYMLQWGTPADLAHYRYHSHYFRKLSGYQKPESLDPNMVHAIPMAGDGARFVAKGFSELKPLIPIGSKAMIALAMDCLPEANRQMLIVRQDHIDVFQVDQKMQTLLPDAQQIIVPGKTQGQAITASYAITADNRNDPLLIAACDHQLLFDSASLTTFMEDKKQDVACFCFSGHPSMQINPQAYGYVKHDQKRGIYQVSVKQPISNHPSGDDAMVGAFLFKKAAYYQEALSILRAKNRRIKGEFYIDSMMQILYELGYYVTCIQVGYQSWGTPDDYATYLYWQTFFDQASFHPYQLANDPFLEESDRPLLAQSLRIISDRYQA